MAKKSPKAGKTKYFSGAVARFHICMTPATQHRARVLSQRENRSFSNTLAVLVDREFERLGLTLENEPKNGKGK